MASDVASERAFAKLGLTGAWLLPSPTPAPFAVDPASLWPALRRQLLWIFVMAVLAAPALTPLAPVVRLTFPAGATLIGGFLLLKRRTAAYVTFCLWLFILTPLARRLVDHHAGFAKANLLMLAPYLAAAWSALALPQFFFGDGRSALRVPVAGVLLGAFYGFLVAVADARFLPGVFDLLRWSVPPLLCAYLVVNAAAWKATSQELTALAVAALLLIGVYSVFQFVGPPSWDSAWMMNSKMGAIGQPAPFEVRVFATLNSPGSLAFYLQSLILIASTAATRLRFASLLGGTVALALSLVRSIWLGVAAGLLILALRSGWRVRLTLAAVIAAGLTLTPVAMTNARTHQVIESRLQSLSNVGGDRSFVERARGYADFAPTLVAQPWGEGIGIANASANLAGDVRIIDGGVIEIVLSLGILGGGLYLLMLADVLVITVARRPAQNPSFCAACATLVTLHILELSSATDVVGETGVLFWLCAAMASSAPAPAVPVSWSPALVRARHAAG